MTTLRILNLVCWGVMLLYMAPGAWAAVSGKGIRFGDPMRLACALTALLNIAFNVRWLIAPDAETVWAMLYIVSGVLALYILRLGHAYGRGGRVDD